MLIKPTATARTRRRIILPATLIAVVLLTAALSGCGALNLGGAKATATPDAATILQRAATASYKDATFSLTVSTVVLGTTTNGTGSGALTKSPERAKITLNIPFTLEGTTSNVTFDIIVDKATDSTYTRITGLPSVGGISLGSDQWTKTSTSAAAGSSPVDVSSLIDVDKMKDAKMIGVETPDGIQVYHLQSTGSSATTTTDATPVTADTTTDIYIRTDNYRVQKITAHTAGTTPSDTTLAFTAYDTGVTIDLPQV
jgi:hypothetical protein